MTTSQHPVGSCGGALKATFGCNCIASDSPAGSENSLVSLGVEDYFGTEERRESLLAGGFVEPTGISAFTSAKSIANRDIDWEQNHLAVGHGGEANDYTVMEDDNTPSKYAGKAISGQSATGNLRTYRRKYEVDGWTLRPNGSWTSFHRKAEAGERTFIATVTATDPNGRSSKVPVRCTYGGPGNWLVEPVGDGAGAPHASEAAAGMQAVLEARRPTQLPRHVGGLAARAREQAAERGQEMHVVGHKLITGLGYSDRDQELTVRTSNGKNYTYDCSPDELKAILDINKPMFTKAGHEIKKPQSKIANNVMREMFRGQKRNEFVRRETCTKCGFAQRTDVDHRCVPRRAPKQHAPSLANKISDSEARRAAENVNQRRRVFRRRRRPEGNE